MQRVFLLSVAIVLGLAWSADRACAETRKQKTSPATKEVKRSLFSGSESEIFNFGQLRPDCTIPTPDIRIVKPATHGDVRFEEVRTVVTADKSQLQKRCLGKPVNAVRMFYKANDDFVGKDRIVVDMDSKAGSVWRISFTVDVR
jgi:hypothetical protein